MTRRMTGGADRNTGDGPGAAATGRHPVLAELLAHWESLRAGRIAPLRSEIDPRRIENVLAHAFILERTAAGEVRIRIAGMKLCELMGMEIRAMPATALIAPEARKEFADLLSRLFRRPEILELRLQDSRAGLEADMMLLPMRSDSGEIARILGCLVADGPASAPPHRFAIGARSSTRIIARATPDLAAGFAETAQPFAPPPRNRARRRPYLWLVKSD